MFISHSGTDCVDTRIKLLIALSIGTASFLMTKELTSHLIFAYAVTVLIAARMLSQALKAVAVYVISLIAMNYLGYIQNTSLIMLFSIILYIIQKFIIITMVMGFIYHTTSVSKVICALESLKIPDKYILPIAVALRFIPSIKEDYFALCENLRIRKIDVSLLGFLRHPVQTTEYLLIPILMRSSKIAEELAAAAMVRGIESGNKKTSLYQMKLNSLDYFVLVIAVLSTGALIWLQSIL